MPVSELALMSLWVQSWMNLGVWAGFESLPHIPCPLCNARLITSPLCAIVPLHNEDAGTFPEEVK